MAEVVGIIASAISIAQLTGQIAHSLVQLKGFWDEVKGAPEDISYLIRDLEQLNLILSEFEQEQTQHTNNPRLGLGFSNNGVRQSISLCEEGARELSILVESLSRQALSTNKLKRVRGSVKIFLKREEIGRLKKRLKRATTCLQLSYQYYSNAFVRLQFEKLSAMLPRNSSSAEILMQDGIQRRSIQTSDVKRIDYYSPAQRQTSSCNLSSRAKGASEVCFVLHSQILGSLLLAQRPKANRKERHENLSRITQREMIAGYQAPDWLSSRAWQICCYRAQMGWTCTLATYNIIPSASEQFRYARTGSLLRLQEMVTMKRASILDQTEDGNTMLSIAAQHGHIDICKWLLQQDSPTENRRFGSILHQVLYYGGWMSFQRGFPMFEIVRLLHRSNDFDIFDCPEGREGTCSFYGRKEVFIWLLNQAQSVGCWRTFDDWARLALNVARNIQHNGPALVKVALGNLDLHHAFKFRDSERITLLHRIACRLGGSFAYQAQRYDESQKCLDDGFILPCNTSIHRLTRDSWRSFLLEANLDEIDQHAISESQLTPLLMGFRTMILIWVGSTTKLIEALNQFLDNWLTDLKSLGVELESYILEESRLLIANLVCKDFVRHQRAAVSGGIRKPVDPNYGTLRLIAFTMSTGAESPKLCWSEPTDEFAGEFWSLCERKSTTIPGSWIEEFEED